MGLPLGLSPLRRGDAYNGQRRDPLIWSSLHSNMSPREPLEPLYAQQVNFVGEQDGPAERELKNRLAQLFRNTSVKQAFLARVDFGGPGGPEVALCIAGPVELPKELVDQIAGVYGTSFAGRDPMDVLVLTTQQQAQLTAICRPFFAK